MSAAFITSAGFFLPGEPVTNENIESILGFVNDRPSRLKSKILAQNGIKTRHYAIDARQQTCYQNAEMAALAIKDCLSHCAVNTGDIELLAVGTTQGDLPIPALASMVQGELEIPACEVITTHAVCTAGLSALKFVCSEVSLGHKKLGVACASELSSRLFKRSRYEVAPCELLDFEAEFLRWMLSDGAGAVLVSDKPRETGLSLKVDWIELISHAGSNATCMHIGSNTHDKTSPYASWQDFESYAAAEKAGVTLLRQDLRILNRIIDFTVDGVEHLIKDGRLVVADIDHVLCHYSSHVFRQPIMDLVEKRGFGVSEEKWFTNLYTRGNTGCASVFLMLEELFNSGKLKVGQTIFCVVPESARFNTAYMKLTVV